jgi:DNA polymerase-3 subunit alpha
MVGSALYITGRVQPGRYDPTKVQVSIGNIQYLHDVKDDLIQKLTIHLNSERLDEDTVLALSEMLKNEPGKVALEIVFHNHDGTSLTMRPSEMKIRVTRVLMDFLQSNENIEYSIN